MSQKSMGGWRFMLNAWIENPPRCYDDIMAPLGCDKYIADSWAMFNREPQQLKE